MKWNSPKCACKCAHTPHTTHTHHTHTPHTHTHTQLMYTLVFSQETERAGEQWADKSNMKACLRHAWKNSSKELISEGRVCVCVCVCVLCVCVVCVVCVCVCVCVFVWWCVCVCVCGVVKVLQHALSVNCIYERMTSRYREKINKQQENKKAAIRFIHFLKKTGAG